MRYADAFCGIGGFSLGIKALIPSAECIWAIDFNKDAAGVFKENFGIDAFGDICSADPDLIPHHDILFGGFPCQPFSRNGLWFNKNNKTIGDTEGRSNLFLELAKILLKKQPKYFLFENVVGLLSMKNLDGSFYVETIEAALKACGYKVEIRKFDAADFGLAQQRRRLFFIGIREDIKQEFIAPHILPRMTSIEDILQFKVDTKYEIKHLWKNRKVELGANRINAVQPNHEFPKGTSRFQVISNIYDVEGRGLALTEKTGKVEAVAILYGDTPSGLPRQQDKVYSIKGVAPTIATFSTPVIDSPNQGLRQLTPVECLRLQGFPDDHIKGKKDAAAYRLIGNAVPPRMVSAILKNLLPLGVL